MEPTLSGDAKADAEKFPMTAELYAYWSELPRAPQPAWADVDLMAIYRIAPLIFVADVVSQTGGTNQFVYRFVGTRIVDIFGVDATGKAVEEAFEGNRAQKIIEAYRYVIEAGKPQLGIRQQANRERGHVRMAVLTVPLFDAAGKVDMLMGINDFSVMDADEVRHFRGHL